MTHDSLETRLAVFRENLRRLEEIPQTTFEEFAADFRNLDSALHRLQTSIQALIDVASFACAEQGLATPSTSRGLLERLEEAGQLPPGSTARFGPIFGFRNRVVHLYERVDASIVYRVLREERQDLADLMDLLLAVLSEDV